MSKTNIVFAKKYEYVWTALCISYSEELLCYHYWILFQLEVNLKPWK